MSTTESVSLEFQSDSRVLPSPSLLLPSSLGRNLNCKTNWKKKTCGKKEIKLIVLAQTILTNFYGKAIQILYPSLQNLQRTRCISLLQSGSSIAHWTGRPPRCRKSPDRDKRKCHLGKKMPLKKTMIVLKAGFSNYAHHGEDCTPWNCWGQQLLLYNFATIFNFFKSSNWGFVWLLCCWDIERYQRTPSYLALKQEKQREESCTLFAEHVCSGQ